MSPAAAERARQVKERLTKPLAPEGAYTVGPWGWGLSEERADALMRKYKKLLSIAGLTADEIALDMVQWSAQLERLADEKAAKRARGRR
jgi:hypothetical protein